MKFRLRVFGLHLATSAVVLVLVLGTLYLGWYHWPGWYLTGVRHVIPITVGVDVALGPLLTLLVASSHKPRRELARDIAIIGTAQLIALVFGATTLWQGRPLYYAFSEEELQIVQASDLDAAQIALGRQLNPELAPYWNELPRWIWAPLPDDPKTREDIVASAISGDNDVIQMPRYFKPWAQGEAALREQLKPVGEQTKYFSKGQRAALAQRMVRLGLRTDAQDTIPLTGRETPLLAIFDPGTLRMQAVIATDR